MPESRPPTEFQEMERERAARRAAAMSNINTNLPFFLNLAESQKKEAAKKQSDVRESHL